MPARTLTALAIAGLATATGTHRLTGRPPIAAAAEGVTLTVVVTGATERGGTIGAALFATPAGFPDGKAPAAALLHPHTAAAADTFVFRNVQPGRYAVAVQHDLNSNGAVDRNLFGAPKEPWGVSNDIRHTFRAPRFEEAAFDVRADMRIDVRVAR
jgi:uncharacterized protein (DUF2141 family)